MKLAPLWLKWHSKFRTSPKHCVWENICRKKIWLVYQLKCARYVLPWRKRQKNLQKATIGHKMRQVCVEQVWTNRLQRQQLWYYSTVWKWVLLYLTGVFSRGLIRWYQKLYTCDIGTYYSEDRQNIRQEPRASDNCDTYDLPVTAPINALTPKRVSSAMTIDYTARYISPCSHTTLPKMTTSYNEQRRNVWKSPWTTRIAHFTTERDT